MSPDLGLRDKEDDESNVEGAKGDFGISGVTPHSPSVFDRNSEEDVCRELMLARRLP